MYRPTDLLRFLFHFLFPYSFRRVSFRLHLHFSFAPLSPQRRCARYLARRQLRSMGGFWEHTSCHKRW